MAWIAYPYDPDDLEARHPPFVQDLIDLKRQGNHDAVGAIIKMIAALKQLGLECGFTKKLHNSPLYELKTHMCGGPKGGARAYLFRAPKDTYMICRAESKTGNDASDELLEDAAYILLAFKQGKPVFPSWLKRKVTYEKEP
jgi:hypothetical protein